MTDRQKGVLNALHLEFVGAENKLCARHVFANLKTRFPKVELRDEFWKAVRASSKDVFVKAMNSIRKVDEDAFQWLRNLNPKHWSVHAFDKFVKCDHTTNNMTESWNAWLGDIRKALVIALVEHIRKRMMKAITERRQSCLKWPIDVLAFINKKLNNMLKVGRNYHVIPASEYTCSCGQWQISGVPCKHAMPCIAHIRATYEKYVAPCS